MTVDMNTLFIFILCFISKMAQGLGETPSPVRPAGDIIAEERVTSTHKTDSLTILMLLGLLLLTVLTIWFFKYRRLRFVHETGLSVIYGLIVGAIIRYTSQPELRTTGHAMLDNGPYDSQHAPEIVFLNLPLSINSTTNDTVTLKYEKVGVVISLETEADLERTVTFDPELFFNVLLPVIIFEAGYSMKRRHFFKNLGAIMTYAFFGTTISCMVVGAVMYGLTRFMDIDFKLNDCFFFGAIISATDPVTILAIFQDLNVDVDLFALVFGESVLNDAVAIVLSESVDEYRKVNELGNQSFSAEAFFKAIGKFLGIFGGAFAIGSAIGCITALLTKFTKIRDFPLLETALFCVMSYSSFQAAEASGLTGIVAVLFCGITQAHYTYNNLSSDSKVRTKQLFGLLNFLAENFVFLYIGVSIFTFQDQKWHAGFIFAAFLAIILGRLCNIYPLSALLNLGRKNKIGVNFMNMMMFAGLRGAIAFALAIRYTSTEAHQYMVSATTTIVLSTVILCGGLSTPMLQWLQIRVGVEEAEQHQEMSTFARIGASSRQYSTMEEPATTTPNVLPQNHGHGPEETEPPPRKTGKAWLVEIWHSFDVRFMKPLLTNSRPTLMETLPACCMPLARLLTTETQMSEGEGNVQEDSDTDMIIDHSELSIGEPSSLRSVSNQSISSKEGPKGHTQDDDIDVWDTSSDDPPITF